MHLRVFGVFLVFLFSLVFVSAVTISSEWTPTGTRVDESLDLRIIFALQQENLQELEKLFWERSNPKHSNYGQYLTRREIADIVAPEGFRDQVLTSWLEANGFEPSQIYHVETRDVITVHGSAMQFEKLLGIEFEYFQHSEVSSRTIVRSQKPVSLPEHIKSHVQLIHGVNDLPPLYRKSRITKEKIENSPQKNTSSQKDSTGPTVKIVSVNARSQQPGPSVVIQASYNCTGNNCPSRLEVTIASANPNTIFLTTGSISVFACQSPSNCTLVIPVQNYVPLNISVIGYDFLNTAITPLSYWDYPVVVNPHVVPQTLWNLYHMTRNPLVTHPNATQCVVEFEQQYYSPSDLNKFFALMGITNKAPVTLIGPNDQNNPGAEANLDIQWIMAMAPGSPTYFWSIEANSTVEIDHILTWCYEIGNYSNPPLVNSLSYGMTESNVDKYLGPGYLNRTNTELQKLALQGLTIIIADGDTGANDIGPPPMSQLSCDPSHPDWPSDSAYVTSVGSTFITPLAEPICYVRGGMNCLDNPLGEVTVSVDMGMSWTTGGGFSFVTPRPSYQDDAVMNYLSQYSQMLPPSSYYNKDGRAYADCVTVGHNLEVVLSGSLVAIDGTSASAPIFAGIVSLLNDARLNAGKSPLGFINQLLYQTLSERPGAWNDITVGHNKCGAYGWMPVCCENGYTCGVGWDPVSGAGSPNVALLREIVLSLP